MLIFAEDLESGLVLVARVLASYTAANINIEVREGKNTVEKVQDTWFVATDSEDFLVKAFRTIHRSKFGNVRFFNLRLENFERDKQSLLAYSF
jgi:hypothetical protein